MEQKGKKRTFSVANQKNIAEQLKAKNANMRKTRIILKLSNNLFWNENKEST